MPRVRYDVIISGASFTGLTMALALDHALGDDLAVLLVDRAAHAPATSATDSRATALSAGSKRLLTTLGLWAAIAPDAQPVTQIEITDSRLDSGIRPVYVAYDNTVGSTTAGADAEPATWIVPNAALSSVLHAAVAGRPSIKLRTGDAATSFLAGLYGATVVLADGATYVAPLVIAADGRRSALREAAQIKVVGSSYAQTGIVTTVAHERPHNSVAVQHFLPAGPFAILPLTGNRSCITWTEQKDEAKRILELDATAFLAEVDLRFGGKLGPLSIIGPRQSWPLDVHLARNFVAPRFALIGDAAHGVHPIAGQGLNLGLRDIAALVEVIADAARVGLDIGNLDTLKRYERWRRFDSLVSAAAFDGLNRLFSNDWPVLRATRDAGLGIVDRLPAIKQMFVAEAAGLSGELPRLLRGDSV
ncbi:MAG: ubiquinone biosynthesis protein UbiH [Hyphomicrobium sp.]|nr:ubiquinone biosynthesis protein UbiH [Hyphomicrobium sp.]PPC83468.1 MAG: ubiquinone biosynthesis protein UbiH [Hyphomicrobium sp.]